MNRIFFFIALLCACSAPAADLVPASKLVPARARVVNGAHGVGVRDGIPTSYGTTVNLTPTNGSNITAAVQSAVNAVSGTAGTLIVIPAGSFVLDPVVFNQVSGLQPRTHFTIRGAGMDLTTVTTTGTAFRSDTYPRYGDANAKLTDIVSGLTADSTSVVVTNASQFVAGRQARIQLPNDYRYPIVQPVSTAQYLRYQTVWIDSVDTGTNTITFSPPIVKDFSDLAALTGVPAKIESDVQKSSVRNVGIEGMTIARTGSSTSAIIDFNNAYNVWLDDVKFSGAINYGMKLTNAVHSQVRRSWIGRTGDTTFHTNQSGLLLTSTSAVLVEDNIFEMSFPCLQLWITNTHTVIGYNYFPLAGFANAIATHNAHNSFMIAEGNILPTVQAESFFGSQSELVYHRNWIYARDGTLRQGIQGTNTIGGPYDVFTNSLHTYCVDLQRWNRQAAIVGNLLLTPINEGTDRGTYIGYPYTGWQTNGEANLAEGDPWEDWDVTTNTIKTWAATIDAHLTATTVRIALATAVADSLEASFVHQTGSGMSRFHWFDWTPGSGAFSARTGDTYIVTVNTGNTFPAVGTAFTIYPGTHGFRERDMGVLSTTTLRANHSYWAGDYGIKSGEEVGADTFVASVYHGSKPTWFGSMAWPPIDPLNPPAAFDQATVSNMLPAAYRYHNANSTAYMGPSAPTFSSHPTTQTATVGDTVTLTVAGGGSPSPTLQWRKGGVNISGATSSSLVLSNVQLADAGSYDVVATNTEGTATSNAGVLTVNAAPSSGGTATIQTLNVGTLNIQ
jgi:hypothetical protein